VAVRNFTDGAGRGGDGVTFWPPRPSLERSLNINNNIFSYINFLAVFHALRTVTGHNVNLTPFHLIVLVSSVHVGDRFFIHCSNHVNGIHWLPKLMFASAIDTSCLTFACIQKICRF
jgi:hypothetical protein